MAKPKLLVEWRWHDKSLPSLVEHSGRVTHRSLLHAAIVSREDDSILALNFTLLWLEITIGYLKP